MNLTDNISTYDRLIEELEATIPPLEKLPPEIDLREDLRGYTGHLHQTPSHERQSVLTSYVKAQVNQALAPWRATVSAGHRILIQASEAIAEINEHMREAAAVASLAKSRIASAESKIEHLKRQTDNFSVKRASVAPVTAYSIWSYRIFIAGSLIVAILTAWFYLNMQITLTAAAQNIEIGSGQTATYPSNMAYLRANPGDWIYLLGVVVFLMAGKIVSKIHETLNHPKWLFLVVAILAVVTPVTTVGLVAEVSTTQRQVQNINAEIAALLGQGGGLFDQAVDCTLEPQNPKCLRAAARREEIKPYQESLRVFGFWMTVSIMLSEILLGSVAWMLASTHYESKTIEGDKIDSRLNLVRDQIAAEKTLIVEQQGEIRDATACQVKGQGQIARLQALMGRLPSEAAINNVIVSRTDDQIQHAKRLLMAAEQQWKIDESKPHAEA